MKDQTRACPLCRGTGRKPQNPRKLCPVCHGRGRIEATFER